MKRLLDWKNNPVRKPLLLFGARQVGKSYLLERFARENYQSYVLLNLEQSRGLRAAFEGDLSPRSVLFNLSQLTHAPLPNANTLLVLDEIQAAPNAITSLKYFAEQMPEQPVVGAGSLLGVAVKGREASYPVGKVNTLTLRPMTFEEFLLGIGEGVRISARNFGWAENVQSIPLYAAGTIAARLAAARRAAGLI